MPRWLNTIIWSQTLQNIRTVLSMPLYWFDRITAEEGDDLWAEKQVFRLYRMHRKGL